jgi:hypothetical protein
MTKQVEAMRYLLDRGYTFDIRTGYIESPHGENGLYLNEEEREALETIAGDFNDGP